MLIAALNHELLVFTQEYNWGPVRAENDAGMSSLMIRDNIVKPLEHSDGVSAV